MEFFLLGEAEKKISSFSDDYKYGALILEKSENFKIQSQFGIFDTVIG